MEALLFQPIPFFSGTDDLILEVEVNVNQDDSYFPIVEIKKEIELKHILKNGISKKELAVILSPLYH
jgi:hypothetical protein